MAFQIDCFCGALFLRRVRRARRLQLPRQFLAKVCDTVMLLLASVDYWGSVKHTAVRRTYLLGLQVYKLILHLPDLPDP